MALNDIVQQIDEEIARLQQVRNLLAHGGGSTGQSSVRRGPGRPPKAASAGSASSAKSGKRGRGGMSAEGRRRIAEAQRKRWAAIKAAKKK